MMMNKKEIILPFREHYNWYFEERYLKAISKEDNAAPWMSFNEVFDQSSFLGDNEDYQNFDL